MSNAKLSPEFQVRGLFYEVQGYRMRKYLDIQRTGSSRQAPQLMVVMMNPGSSCPLDGRHNGRRARVAQADTTQRQIMRVMRATGLDCARVLNLSDLRTPDSGQLYAFLRSAQARQVDHSLFSRTRKRELKRLFTRDVPVVYAWGVHKALLPLAQRAMEALDIAEPAGLLKPGTRYSFYHPLPRSARKQREWVEAVAAQLEQGPQRRPVAGWPAGKVV